MYMYTCSIFHHPDYHHDRRHDWISEIGVDMTTDSSEAGNLGRLVSEHSSNLLCLRIHSRPWKGFLNSRKHACLLFSTFLIPIVDALIDLGLLHAISFHKPVQSTSLCGSKKSGHVTTSLFYVEITMSQIFHSIIHPFPCVIKGISVNNAQSSAYYIFYHPCGAFIRTIIWSRLFSHFSMAFQCSRVCE